MPPDTGRRNFLVRCCQALSAGFLPATFRGLAFSSFDLANIEPIQGSEAEFHLHPHYRSPTPLDATLLKAKAGLDEFVTEKYADRIAAILGDWSAGLLGSPEDTKAIERVLATNFVGAPLGSGKSVVVRSGSPVEVQRYTLASSASLAPNAFLQQLRLYLQPFSKLLTAEFQITKVVEAETGAGDAARLQTRIRYEFVGTGRDFHREQRTGLWDLTWEGNSSGSFRLQNWEATDETRSRSSKPVFVDISAQSLGSNASYDSQLLRGTDYWRTVLDGACGIDIYGHNGVAVGDIDGDGFDDLYICQPGGLPNRLYRNRGDGSFEDITEASGVGVLENTACALFIDVDNDGRQDLIVVRANGPLLFVNEGAGKFRLKPNAFQFATPPQGTFTGAAAADYDRDGWLDIYFCLYVYYQGADQYKYPAPYYDAQNGPPNFLMRSQRNGTFRDVTREAGLDHNNTRYSFCCGWSDFDGSGWPDLYVVNDFGRKNLYRNNADGTFTDVADRMGVEDVGAGMGVCWFDYDNDGNNDLYVANMWTAAGERIAAQDIFKKNEPEEMRAKYRKHAMGNSLLRNTGGGQGRFQDATAAAGAGLGRWSWSSDAWDFDHDGFPDLYVTNGMISGPSREDLNSFFWRQVVAKSPEEAKPSQDYERGWNAINDLIRADGTWSGFERNVCYANNRDGTFSDVSGAVELDFVEDGRSFALADFDHDGRQELFLKNRNAPQLRILKNVVEDLPSSIAFVLRGTKSNRDAIGASVTIETDIGHQTRFLQAGSGFLAQHSKEIVFGLGGAKGPLTASLRWPSGLIQKISDLRPNQRIKVTEGDDRPVAEAFTNVPRHQQTLVESKTTDEDFASGIETWLLAPIAAPEFELAGVDGKTYSLRSFRGGPLLVNFWSMQSGRCEQELTNFERAYSKWMAQGLRLVAINVDDGAAAGGIEEFARTRHFAFPILRGSDDVAAIYNIVYRQVFDRHRDLSLPTSLLIDEAGQIVKVYHGPVNAAQLEKDFLQIPRTAAERRRKALPFAGMIEVEEFGRNYLSFGSVFFQRGYYDQAGAAFERALHDDPESAEALYGLGSVYLNQGKNAEARESFDRATKLRASYPGTLANSWNNLGLLSAREGRTEEAIGFFRQALQLSPDHIIALVNLGGAYRQRKRWDDAREIYERALAVDAIDAEANYGIGMVFAQTDDTTRAFEHLSRALQTRPTYPEALNNLGILHLRTQRRDQAVAKFEECIRVAPGFEQAYLNLARVYVIEESPEKARAVLLDLLKQHPGQPQAQEMLSKLRQ